MNPARCIPRRAVLAGGAAAVSGAVALPLLTLSGTAGEHGVAARRLVRDLYPGREVVPLTFNNLAEGGGGIHCATQQQPAVDGPG